MRIAVTGRSGQLVTAMLTLAEEAGVEVLAVGRPELDLERPETAEAVIAAVKPDLIVSAAAYTAVDKAESEPESAFAVNARAPGIIAGVARRLGVPVIHISTDYVFDGSKSGLYIETDATNALSVYGASKLAGELAVAAETPDHVILRTAWVYSPFGANFLKTMLRLGETRNSLSVVADQFGRPTSALEIARAVFAVAKRLKADDADALRGIFHLSADGEGSWADFAEAIFAGAEERGRPPVGVKRITTAEYPTPAKRPSNSRLSTEKLKQAYDVQLPDWRHSLDECLDQLLGKPTISVTGDTSKTEAGL